MKLSVKLHSHLGTSTTKCGANYNNWTISNNLHDQEETPAIIKCNSLTYVP